MTFDLETRTKVLLWCDRHCCICKKSCGINIEAHHIVPKGQGGRDDIDNAIPLCFECHSWVEHYNAEHPRGNKYKPDELRARREQVYEEFTRHLVPPIRYRLTQDIPGANPRPFPDVGFEIQHVGDSLPVKVRVRVESENVNEQLDLPDYYTGKKHWNLNPRFRVMGHFPLPSSFVDRQTATLRLAVSVIYQYGREHHFLPVGYTYVPDRNSWYPEPWSRDI